MRSKGDGEGSLWKEGKYWIGRYVIWTDGIRKRPKKIVGKIEDLPSKREAREELNRIIREATGRVGPMPKAPTFADVWARYLALQKPRWSKPQIEAVEIIIRRAVLPAIGDRILSELTREPLQAALNHMAEAPLLIGVKNQYTRIGYGESAIKRARTYIHAVFEFGIDEGIVSRNPARKLEMPRTRKTCERFLTMEEVHRLTGAAAGREKLILRLFLVAGLRPAELFALKTDDIQPGALRIDEAVHNREREATGRRIGDTKTVGSDGLVAISADLEAELRGWAETRAVGALLFPTEKGTTWRIGNYLKRVLKPLAASVGIEGLTHQCLRRTCATHFVGDTKERQEHMRHADPATTLRHYQKSIGSEQWAAVEALDAKFMAVETKVERVQ